VLATANRTWAISVGISSRKDTEFEIVQYEERSLDIMAEHNSTQPCSNSSDHPIVPGILYIDVFGDGACNPCVGDLFMSQYGNITAEFLYRNPAPMSESGDTMLAVYDFDANFVYIAFSQNGTAAYTRPQMAFNMTMLFSFEPNMTFSE